MSVHAMVQEETRATSQHQVTIPKKIWNSLKLEVGTRFSMILTQDNQIVMVPQPLDNTELSDSQWHQLVKLAHSQSNVSKRFTHSKDAITYLKKL